MKQSDWSEPPRVEHRLHGEPTIADHPFLFGIYDRPTATWLFLGHVVDPTQG